MGWSVKNYVYITSKPNGTPWDSYNADSPLKRIYYNCLVELGRTQAFKLYFSLRSTIFLSNQTESKHVRGKLIPARTLFDES